MNIEVGALIAIIFGGGGIITLIVFSIKAQVHKQMSPFKEKITTLETKMTLFEKSHDTIIELLEKIDKSQGLIPDQIDAKIKAREEVFDLRYAKKPQ